MVNYRNFTLIHVLPDASYHFRCHPETTSMIYGQTVRRTDGQTQINVPRFSESIGQYLFQWWFYFNSVCKVFLIMKYIPNYYWTNYLNIGCISITVLKWLLDWNTFPTTIEIFFSIVFVFQLWSQQCIQFNDKMEDANRKKRIFPFIQPRRMK